MTNCWRHSVYQWNSEKLLQAISLGSPQIFVDIIFRNNPLPRFSQWRVKKNPLLSDREGENSHFKYTQSILHNSGQSPSKGKRLPGPYPNWGKGNLPKLQLPLDFLSYLRKWIKSWETYGKDTVQAHRPTKRLRLN